MNRRIVEEPRILRVEVQASVVPTGHRPLSASCVAVDTWVSTQIQRIAGEGASRRYFAGDSQNRRAFRPIRGGSSDSVLTIGRKGWGPMDGAARRPLLRANKARGERIGASRVRKKRTAHGGVREPSQMVPAITYFRTFQHYHRPEELNDRVRNGNECFPPGKVTGKRQERRRPARTCLGIKEGAVKRHLQTSPAGPGRAKRRRRVLSCGNGPRNLHGARRASRRESKWSSIRPLVLVSCDDYSPCTTSLSTWSSSRGLQDRSPTKPDLGDGFALICFQRLSRPYVSYPAVPRA